MYGYVNAIATILKRPSSLHACKLMFGVMGERRDDGHCLTPKHMDDKIIKALLYLLSLIYTAGYLRYIFHLTIT